VPHKFPRCGCDRKGGYALTLVLTCFVLPPTLMTWPTSLTRGGREGSRLYYAGDSGNLLFLGQAIPL